MTKDLSSAEIEFLKAFETLVPPPAIVEEYRAYYNNEGWVTSYEANNFPPEGNWISITKETYMSHNWQWMRIVNGILTKQVPDNRYHFPLTKSNKGVKVVRYHANIVVESHEECNDIEYYDRRTS